jgi:hypothetical protein
MKNALLTIRPYWCDQTQTWVFDDERVGLVREPFVLGIPQMINRLLEEEGVENARQGFRLIFSENRFPGSTQLDWLRDEDGGCWYRSPDFDLEGWLCPAMFHYFEQAPERIFVKAEPLSDASN